MRLMQYCPTLNKRAAYDRYGHAGVNGMGGMPDFSTVDFSDIFEEFFGFGGMGGGSRRKNAPRRGADLSYAVTLEFEEAVFGIDKEIEISRDEVCSTLPWNWCREQGQARLPARIVVDRVKSVR